jgi:ribonuclease BN (tRNA processing enzyme)
MTTGLKLTIVGCSGSVPGPASPASCYLVEAGGHRVLLDLGSGALGALYTHVSPYAIDAVLLSHLHADHCFDLASLYVARYYHPDGPFPHIPVYGPPGTDERIARAYGMDSTEEIHAAFTFTEWSDEAHYDIGPMHVTVRTVAHPVACFAMRVEHAGRSLVFSGDTGPTDALVSLARGADLLLCEASFVEGDVNPPGLHLTGRQAGDHAERAGVGRLLLTHIPPWRDPDRALAEATPAFGGRLGLAEPGASYDV